MSWKLASLSLLGAVTSLGMACVTQGPSGLDLTTPGSSGDPTGTTGAGASGPTSGSGTVTNARDMFINKVYPSLMTEPKPQSCGSCHDGSTAAPQFLVDTAEGSYTYLDTQTDYITLPDNSILYLHGLTVHTGPAYTPDQAELVKTWLMAEAEERGLITGDTSSSGGPVAKKTLKEAVTEFGDCMSLDDWTANGLQELCNMQVDGGERCKDCHSNGQNNTWLGPDVEMTFEKNSEYPFIMRLISGTVDEDGNFLDLVESKSFQLKGTKPCNQEPCHPKFVLSDELKAGLHTFFALTKVKYDAGMCQTSGTGGGGGAGGGP